MKELIKQLVETCGPSGQEGQVRALIEGLVAETADEVRVDVMGNLIALKRGSGGGERIMVAAHMDEIGLIVTHVDKQGFMRFAAVGGVRPQTLVGSRVQFVKGQQGVIGWEKWLEANALPKDEELFIDVGAASADQAPVGVGDQACFVRPLVDLGERMVSKAMDDRIGCAVAIQTLLNLGSSPNEVYFVFTVQEEVGTRGAMVSAFGLEPEVGLAVDVTPVRDTPEARPMAVSLGEGPAIKVMDSGALTHPGVKRWMINTAEALGVPYQLEVLQAGGTDARAIQQSRAGVPSGCLSIPCRYVHTPSEMVDYGDVQGAVRLLGALLANEVAI
ncbi:MAG: M42 family metallopeptidase [Anaerolineae bacterium]|nr:M42 family metallopeptidase [Anaerolineae bacterium]